MPTTHRHKVQLSSVEVLPDGESFVLGLVAADQEVHRMEFPSWTVLQLMRLLPRLNASLLEGQGQTPPGLLAYPVVQWCVQPAGDDREVALSLRTDQHVESAYLFGADEAQAIHAALGEAIAVSARDQQQVRRPA